MDLVIQVSQFILSISILVILHELGHYLPAKWFKTRAEKFYLFFDPWFSLFAMKKINGKWKHKFFFKNLADTEIIEVDGKKKEVPINVENLPDDDWRKHRDSTQWGIGWLPFGGYVKIAGMIDESMDTEQMKKPAEPWEFRSKPAWQRLIIMLGGVTVNFFLAWLIFSALSFFNGESYYDNTKIEDGIAVNTAGEKMGLKSGDRIISIDGKEIKSFNSLGVEILFADKVNVLRDGKEIVLDINKEGVGEVLKTGTGGYLSVRTPTIVDSVLEGKPAKLAGLEKGDKIVGINGQPTLFFDEVTKALELNKNQKVSVEFIRNNDHKNVEVVTDEHGKLGFIPDITPMKNILEQAKVTQEIGFFASIPRGFERTIESLTQQVKQFKILFNKQTEGYKQVSGPIGIVKMMPTEFNWTAFWSFTAMFSVWLAFLNLLPIPGLDGGHVVFTLWEIITGKPASEKVLEYAQMIGVIFLLGLMILIFGNDVYKLF